MAVTVKLMGGLHRFADSETIDIEGEGCTLGVAIDEIARRYPKLGAQLLNDEGKLRYMTLLVLTGRSLTWPQDRKEPIADGGELLIMRFMAGG